MRSHSEYIPLTQEQIAAAQHTDIAEYLRERGEKVQKEGNHYTSFFEREGGMGNDSLCAGNASGKISERRS